MMTNRLKRIGSLAVSAALAVSLFSGCASTASEPTGPAPTVPVEIMEEAYVDALSLELVELEDEAVALSAAPAAVGSLLLSDRRPQRPGARVGLGWGSLGSHCQRWQPSRLLLP